MGERLFAGMSSGILRKIHPLYFSKEPSHRTRLIVGSVALLWIERAISLLDITCPESRFIRAFESRRDCPATLKVQLGTRCPFLMVPAFKPVRQQGAVASVRNPTERVTREPDGAITVRLRLIPQT